MAWMTGSQPLSSLPSEGLLKEKNIFLHCTAYDFILSRAEDPIVAAFVCFVLQYCR